MEVIKLRQAALWTQKDGTTSRHPDLMALLLSYYLVAFFLLATVLRLPLRVRELFLVR